MDSTDLRPAPLPELVRYLALFHRALQAIRDYGQAGDREGMLLGGWIADALHNVPKTLYRYDWGGWDSTAEVDARLRRFPKLVRELGGPARIIAAADDIFRDEGYAVELGLEPDLRDAEVASPPQLRQYSELLYQGCLDIRTIRNEAFGPAPPWHLLNETWSELGDLQGESNTVLATILLPIPAGLLHWKQFDERKFLERALRLGSTTQVGEHSLWDRYFPGT